jgi:hypothetical protein
LQFWLGEQAGAIVEPALFLPTMTSAAAIVVAKNKVIRVHMDSSLLVSSTILEGLVNMYLWP